MALALPPIFRRRGARILLGFFAVVLVIAYAFPDSSGQVSQYFNGLSIPLQKRALKYGSNGLAYDWVIGERVHPIEELMENGRVKWEGLLKGQSKTLEQAVKEYKRRYRRSPPKGFDAWWKWAMENEVKIVDDYDQINRDLRPFWAFSPATFRKMAKDLETESTAFVTHLDPKGDSHFDGGNPNFRAENIFNLLRPIIRLLPDAVEFTTTTHDLGTWLPGADQMEFLEEKIEDGEYATEEDLKPFMVGHRHRDKGVPGLASACPTDSPAWQDSVAKHEAGEPPHVARPQYTPIDAEHPNFIHDPRASYDFCYNTEPLKFHGALSMDGPKLPIIRPMFQQSKFLRNGEIVLTPLDYYFNVSGRSSNQEPYMAWDNKHTPKLHWRGKTTGDAFSARDDYNWRNSHRIRLHTLTHDKKGHRELYVKSRRTGGWEIQTWEAGKVNEAYMDVGLTDGPMQCNKEDGTCKEMQDAIDWSPRVQPQDAANFKYVIDVDGNGWSSRFHRLLASESVVIKSTLYPEFFSDWLIPWYHYVPIQPSYSELYLVMSFFVGVPGSPSTGHDELAREIAENGRKFTLEHWRWEDMQSYMFRLLLEYIRLGKDDREGWEYKE